MPRATMALLITRTREMIGDAAGASQQFSDDQIQAALDRRARNVVEMPLDAVVSRAVDGTQQSLRWMAARGPWESGAVILSENRIPIAVGITADEMASTWTFATTQDAAYVSGITYDIYGAAADLLEIWAIAGSFSTAGGGIVEWETDGQRVKRAVSTTEERRSLASAYRAQSLPVTGSFERNDGITAGSWW